MWKVQNRTPFAAIGYFVRDRHGAEHWVVAVTGCFDISHDELLALAQEQAPPLIAPKYVDLASRELLAEADLAPFRPDPEFTVSGVACPPNGAAARQFDAGIAVAQVRKQARFFGDRKLRRRAGKTVIEGPSEILGVRLTWRNALGGPDVLDAAADLHDRNPIGIGWTRAWAELPDGAEFDLPFMEDPAQPIKPDRPLPAPCGFGPLQPAWRPRRDHAGTYDETWLASRSPLPPDDFSDAFYQAAPPDQIHRGPLEGGAPVLVDGFHPDGPYGFRLPQLILEASTRIGTFTVETRLRLIGLALDATAKTVRLTWNTHVPCNGRDHLVEGSTVELKQMAGVAR